jgi:GNAT superfamily N-acetyltransferase
MSIRRATVDDAPAVAALATELGYPCDAETMRARLAAVPHDAQRTVLVIERDGEVLGMIDLATVEAIESGAWTEIRGLVVASAARSHGLGAQLLEAAEAWARERGHTRVRLRTNVTRERAHQFYLRHGYAITKTSYAMEKRL